MVNAIIS